MEAISLITTALIAGAEAAAKDTAGTAVKEAYDGLKKLIKRKFEGDPSSQGLVDGKPEKIKQEEDLLKEKISNAGVDKDEEIINKAQELLEPLKSKESKTGESNIKVGRDFKGFSGNNSGTVNQTIN
ncbi:MAG TPA: hypothetical protein DCF68_20820 [Cyanothece sp. UBA12306]|nr:hypothetical protein [Cyanothece sp. UBA12306]